MLPLDLLHLLHVFPCLGYLRQAAGSLGTQGEQKLAGKGRQPEDPVTAAGRVGLRVRLYHLQNSSVATEIPGLAGILLRLDPNYVTGLRFSTP